MCQAERIRAKLRAGRLIVGGHTFLKDPAITEMLGFHGYEFVWIDGEHGAFNPETLLLHIVAADAAGTASFVRVAWNDPVVIKPVLDMGPDGLIAPMICTEEEARAFVRACSYPPEGVRGFGPRRACRYGAVDTPAYAREAQARMLRIPQIEHIEAVRNLAAIIAVRGIDLVIIGPNDLSASMGHLGDTRHPDMMPVYDEIAAVCVRAGMPFGVSLGPTDMVSADEWKKRGASLIGCGDDISFISIGARKTIAAIRSEA